MDVYTSEDQQIEMIKKWWRANGTGVLVGIVLAITAVLAWQFWHQNKQANREAAAALYGQLVDAASSLDQSRLAGETEKSEDQMATLTHLGEQLKTDFSDSEYAVYAALMLAKEAVLNNEMSPAQEQLKWAKDNTENEPLKLIANLRLTRVLAQEKQYEAALKQLDSVQPGAQADAYEEVRGDIYVAMGETKKARDAYELAMTLSAARSEGQSRPILKIKHDNLLVAGN